MGVNIMLLGPLISVIETLKERIAVHGASLRENETRLAARAGAFSGWLRVRGCWLWIRPERVFLPRAWVRKFDTTASDCHRLPLRMQSLAECNSPEYRVGAGWTDYALRSVGNKPAAVIGSSTRDGQPDTTLEKPKYPHRRLGMEHLVSHGQEFKMSHEATMSNIGLFGKEVLTVIKTQ